MTTFTDPFGGGQLQPAQVGYAALALTANTTLVWPPYATTTTDSAANTMDVTPSTGGFVLELPDATQVAAGTALTIRNLGAYSFQVNDAGGNSLATIAAGAVRYLYLQDNSTSAGAWASILLGVGSSALDASQLRGLGLLVQGNTLAWGPITGTLSVDTTLDAVTDRAAVYVWTGGAGALTMPALADAGVDFVVEVRNQGTGVLTITPVGGEQIDDANNIALQVAESGFIHAGPAAWYTVGRGRNAQFNFTRLTKTVTGGTTTLSLTEAANVVQTYNGTLASDEIVVVPAMVQVYYISNGTSGVHTFTVKSPVAGGTTVAIATGTNAIVFCDGVNVISCTTGGGSSFSPALAVGSVGTPSLSFTGDPTTGLYQPISGSIGYAISGLLRVLMNAAGMAIAGDLSATTIGGVTPGPGTFTTFAAVDAAIANLEITNTLTVNSVAITPVELSYLDGLSGNVQAQINAFSPVLFGAEIDNGNSGVAKTITLAAGLKQRITLNSATPALTFDFTAAPVATYLVRLIQDGPGGRVPSYIGLDPARWLSSATPPGINLASGGETLLAIAYNGVTAEQASNKVGAA